MVAAAIERGSSPPQDPRPGVREEPAGIDGQPPTVADWPTLRGPTTALLRARLRRDLLALASDVVGRCEHDELSREDKDLLQTVMRGAVEAVADDVGRRLWAELAGRLATLPPDLRARLERSLARGALGLD